ncbi:flippase [Porphyromonadaceae bacterium W3.11]|nr:flippase [Porphyromonadaceae bacterium W3.11]
MKEKIRKGIKRIRSSKDATVLLSNFGYLTLLQVASYIFPLITIPYLARVIGVDSFGKIAFASAIIMWFQTIADWGFNYTATRDVAKNREDKEKISEIFSDVLWGRCLLMAISFLILLASLFLIPKFSENRTVILITFLIIPGQIMFPDWFFQAMERMKYITILNVLSKLIFTVAVFIFIKEKSDYILQPLFTSLGYIVSGVIAMYLILCKWNVKLKKPTFSGALKAIKNSTDVFINNIMPNFYNSFTIVLLGVFGGSVSNGLLDAGNKLVTIFQKFMIMISRTFFPFLTRRIEKHDIYVKINIYLSLAFSFFLFLLAPLLVKLFFTPEFGNAVSVLRIMSISLVFLALSNIYGTNFMIILGHERKLRNVTFISSILGFLLSFPLVYYFDYIGAALTITLTRAILGISVMKTGRKIKSESGY